MKGDGIEAATHVNNRMKRGKQGRITLISKSSIEPHTNLYTHTYIEI